MKRSNKKFFRKAISKVICISLIATTFACSSAVKSVENKVDENAEAITKNERINQNAENANDVGNQSETLGNAASYALSIDNKTIDPTIYLDYKKGIEEKVYKWVKSDDGKYYTFAYIDETGNPVKSSEAKINVGANNQESIDNGNKSGGDKAVLLKAEDQKVVRKVVRQAECKVVCQVA